MASSTWHRINVVCFCLTLLVQRSGSVLATNEVNVIPASVQTSIGSTITLDCTQAQNTSVLWFQDDKQLPTTTQQLILSDVSVANKGIYKCCLKECSAGNSATSTVDIGEGPRQPLDLTCECRDYMNINCSWTMSDDGDAKSNISMRIQDYDTLKWHNLPCKASNDLPQDKHQYCFFNLHDYKFYKSGYVYKIRSANKYGEAFSEEVNFHLAQQAMPYPPDDVIIQALSSNSVNVTWCEPPLWAVSQARRLEFKVEYKPEGGNKWVVAGSKKFGPGEPRKKLCTSMKIHSLEPYTSYCTQIRARKDSSSYSTFSEPSNTVCATTMEDDPGKPWDVKYRILPSADDEKDTRSVSITWKPVHKEERNGIILGYRIVLHGVHGSDETNTTRLEYNVTGTNLTVHGLDNYRTYTITVQAFNSAGMSWEKASPDGPIPVAPDKAGEVSHIFVALMVPIAIVCLVFMSYCIWHRGKKILKPTYDIQIPERARNDNLYVTTVNFRMQESECLMS
ncbi:cell adhesion molecule DSCAM-like [Amphiura filiformis]|uniref:cell adhesion molecule DSCAM-like n=1 Tax=Amphiura filiformis TaxID=82378 RepID=UPI003B217F4F